MAKAIREWYCRECRGEGGGWPGQGRQIHLPRGRRSHEGRVGLREWWYVSVGDYWFVVSWSGDSTVSPNTGSHQMGSLCSGVGGQRRWVG